MTKIDAERGWFKGVGDIVVYAYIGEGCRVAGEEVEFFSTVPWRVELLKAFDLKVTDNPKDALRLTEGYETAVKFNDPRNYLEWIHDKLGEARRSEFPPPAHPRLFLNPTDREYGRSASSEILIFPHCAWTPRTWPKNYFIELADLLKKEGYRVTMVMEERDGAFLHLPIIYGKSWSFIAGAIQMAHLVIGNDSGPAHLAGVIGTRAMAIMGPTQGARIFGYTDKVTALEAGGIGCEGCHCLPPAWRQSCGFGCHSLYRTLPEQAFAMATRLLSGELPQPKPMIGFNLETQQWGFTTQLEKAA